MTAASRPATDLLELLDEQAGAPALVHAVRPNMWAACGWCACRCQGRARDRYVLRINSTAGVTCPECVAVMEERPWTTP